VAFVHFIGFNCRRHTRRMSNGNLEALRTTVRNRHSNYLLCNERLA